MRNAVQCSAGRWTIPPYTQAGTCLLIGTRSRPHDQINNRAASSKSICLCSLKEDHDKSGKLLTKEPRSTYRLVHVLSIYVYETSDYCTCLDCQNSHKHAKEYGVDFHCRHRVSRSRCCSLPQWLVYPMPFAVSMHPLATSAHVAGPL